MKTLDFIYTVYIYAYTYIYILIYIYIYIYMEFNFENMNKNGFIVEIGFKGQCYSKKPWSPRSMFPSTNPTTQLEMGI